LRLNGLRGPGANVFPAATRQAADCPNGHIVIAEDLATEPDSGQAASGERILLGDGRTLRLTGQELHSAGSATRIAAAGVQLIDLGLIFQGQNQALSLWDVEFANIGDG
jgi:hypothetical protein